MGTELKHRRGTTAEHSTFTGAEGEVTVDTTKDTVVVHDGVTAGGVPLAKESDIPTGALADLNEVNASTIADNSVGAAELNVPGNGAAGQYLASDGDGTMTWTTLAAGGGFSNMQVFTSPGTWTNPGDVEKVKVTVVGGGGGGGNCNSIPGPQAKQRQAGGGGGGGAAIEVIPFPSGTNVAVTVGGESGTSSFGAYVSATGGTTGASISNVNSSVLAAGGTGSGGTINLPGQVGGYADAAWGNNDGGDSLIGHGGYHVLAGPGPVSYNPGPPTRPGQPGYGYGGGGSGAATGMPFPGAGGNGQPGVVIVEY